MNSFVHRFFTAIGLAALLVLVAAGPVAAQSNTVEVKCVLEDGQPVRGARVSVFKIQGDVQEKKTNKNGLIQFKKLEDGFYRVWARAEGYAPTLHEFFELRGSSQPTIELVLKPGNFEEPLYFEDDALGSQAVQLIMEGVQAIRENRILEAEEKLNASLAINPSSLDALQNLALVYLQAQRWDEAEKRLNETIELLDVFVGLGQTDMKALQQQLATLRDSIPLQKIAAKADELMKERRFDEAVVQFEVMLKVNANNADVYYNMALAQAHGEHIPEAKASIDKALELRPEDEGFARLRQQILQIEKTGESLRAKESLAEIEKLYGQEDYSSVLQRCQEDIDSMPEEYKAQFQTWAARAQVKLGESEKAVSAYQEAIRLAPELVEVRRELAEYLFSQESYNDGVEAYKGLFEAASKAPDQGLYELGVGFSQKGNQELAALLFQKVLEVNANFAEAYFELGTYFYYEKGDKQKAKEFLNKYLELGETQEVDPTHLENAKAVLIVMDKLK